MRVVKSTALLMKLEPEAVETIEALRQKLGLDSRAAVIREALATYVWLHKKMDDGWKIQIRNGNTVSSLTFDCKPEVKS